MLSKKLTYYSLILFSVGFTLLIFYFIYQRYGTDYSQTFAGEILFWSKLFWFTGGLVAVTNIVGLLRFGPPDQRNMSDIELLKKDGWNQNKKLIIVYVSRGDNFRALERAIVSAGNMLSKHNINHRIDVVTDLPVQDKHSHSHPVIYHVVPGDYTTATGSKYKARALHYVVDEHGKEGLHESDTDNWLLHLDEESIIDISAVAGIHVFINNPANAGCVGQGEIKYNAHNYGSHTLITVMDAMRTGDDLGRFRFQYGLFDKPLFGMHGSFILIPSDIEQSYGFDLGGKGSITEDAYFALICGSDGVPFRWVNGYIREQSPFSVSAILKQRRRWYCGLMYLAFDKDVKLKTRFLMIVNMLLWTVAWIGPIVTVINLIYGGYFPVVLFAIAALLQGFYFSIYTIGLWRNLQDVNFGFLKQVKLYLATFLLMPVANALEGVAVLYGIFKPVKHFDVVNKN